MGQENIQTRSIKLHYLYPPVYLGINIHDGINSCCDLLNQNQLDYFKTKGNNALIFIHGYNVSPGYFGKEQLHVETASIGGAAEHGDPNQRSTLLISTYGCDCTYLRCFQDIQNGIAPSLLNHSQLINYQPCHTPWDQDMAVDSALNGTEAHNWLLHMEYNLNCAAAGAYPFPWAQQALDYTRIITVYWPGDVLAPDFWKAQKNAVNSGAALSQLLKELHSAGLSLNIVAHSLGTLVTLQALEILGQSGQYQLVDQAILWQAAVANRALSPEILPPAEQVPNAYFPHANYGAKQFVVLTSQQDSVLEFLYHLQDDVGYLAHPDLRFLALGRAGPDNQTRQALGAKLITVDQKNWLTGHSDMRIPTPVLFENIYQKVIYKQISHFGKYK